MSNREMAARAKNRRFRTTLDRVIERYRMEELENRLLLSGSAMSPAGTQAAKSRAVEALNLSSAVFVENQGQWADSSVKYAYNGQGINVGFTDTGPVLEVLRARPPAADGTSIDALSIPTAKPPEMDRARVTMSFDGARSTMPVGADRSATSFNYLVGEESQHRSNVAGFQKISYSGLYQGIDLLTWGQRDGMKYEFHVAPGADWRKIRVSYDGIAGLSLGVDGSLHAATPLGDLVEQAPILYQVVDGNRVAVAGRFVLLDADTYAFAVTGTYDTSRELVIDPDLAWATYLGGSGSDGGYGIAVDGSGNVYVTGQTASGGWATAGVYDTTYNGGSDDGDVFVAKLNASGSSLLYATYLGGSGNDSGRGIAVDSSGNACVAGYTFSAGWATAGAYDTTYNGNSDIFVAKLSASGSSLLYATYLGGSHDDYGFGIAVDGAGNACVTGQSNSAGWATAGAYNTTYNGGVANSNTDAFVAKLSASGSSLLHATYLGGSGNDYGYGIAVDGAGNTYVTGATSSPGWTTAGAYNTIYNGGVPNSSLDVFVAKLNASGSSLLYATYLGGSDRDVGIGIAVDGVGNAFVTGFTDSAGWATAGAYDTIYNGDIDTFVAKLSASGSSLLYATYLGGSGQNFGEGIAVDGSGNAYLSGQTTSDGWATAGAYDTTNGGNDDMFLAKFNASGSSLLYATFLGSYGDDFGRGIAVDGSGNAYVIGQTASGGWATAGASDTTYNGGAHDAFVLKFSGLVELFPGDTNGDGKVDFQDLVAVAQNYGGSGKTRAQGDVTGDGNVDFQDLVIIAQNYGNPAAAPAPSAPAPAPTPVPTASTRTPAPMRHPPLRVARPSAISKAPRPAHHPGRGLGRARPIDAQAHGFQCPQAHRRCHLEPLIDQGLNDMGGPSMPPLTQFPQARTIHPTGSS